jgi:hypothetical protein
MPRSSEPAEGNATGKADQPGRPAAARAPTPGAGIKRAQSPSRTKTRPMPDVAAALAAKPEAGPHAAGAQAPREIGAGAEEAPSAALTTVVDEIKRLRGATTAFWQDHLERTVAAGQAIVSCPTPQAAMVLQMSYLRASLASTIAHAVNLARLSTEIIRTVGLLRDR